MKFAVMAMVLAGVAIPTLAHADLLERRTGRVIRQAGQWCGKVSHMAVNDKVSTPTHRVVRVTCDDGTRYVQYDLVISPDNKVQSIEKAKP